MDIVHLIIQNTHRNEQILFAGTGFDAVCNPGTSGPGREHGLLQVSGPAR
jgi:hypothetical protein